MQRDGTLETDPEYRCVNFNTSEDFYYRDQFAVYLVDDGLNPDPSYKTDAGFNYEHTAYANKKDGRLAFPLKSIYKVSVFPTGMDNAVAGLGAPLRARVKGELLTTTVIHEIGYALGMRHHWDAASKTTQIALKH